MPEYLCADPNVSMIPLTVYFGDEAFQDVWVDLKTSRFLPTAGSGSRASKDFPTVRGGFSERV
jgi:hypothetical protein